MWFIRKNKKDVGHPHRDSSFWELGNKRKTYFSNDIKLPSLSWVRIIITKNQLLCPGKRLRILLFSKQKTTRF